MKNLIIVFIMTSIGFTGLHWLEKQESAQSDRTITSYGIDKRVARDLREVFSKKEKELTTARIDSFRVEGKERLIQNISNISSFLKEKKINYRSEFDQAFQGITNNVKQVEPDKVNEFHTRIDMIIQVQLIKLRSVKMSENVKYDLIRKMNNLKDILVIKKHSEKVTAGNTTFYLKQVQTLVKNLYSPRQITVNFERPRSFLLEKTFVVFVCTAILVVYFTFFSTSNSVQTAASKESVNPSQLTVRKSYDHLVDSHQVEAFVTAQKNSKHDFKELNQVVADSALKLGHLFKVTGKVLDIDFNENVADCFVEASKLEVMIQEFVISCHHIIQNRFEVSTLFLRTDEQGQKMIVSCFIPEVSAQDFEGMDAARKFLSRFSILEAKFSMCSPVVDFRTVNINGLKGMDITLSFDNRSEIEGLLIHEHSLSV